VSVAPGSGREIAIVGAGLAGSLLACLLARRGHAVALYERRPDPRVAGAESGRSINLAISERGLAALAEVGLAETVLEQSLPMRGRMLHDSHGSLTFQAYSADGTRAINSVSRAGLNNLLLDAAAAHAEVRLHFGHRLVDLDLGSSQPRLTFERLGAQPGQRTADLVVGADGAYSEVRLLLQRQEASQCTQSFLDYGYKELTIPPTDDGGFALDPGALHIWPRGGSMMIALPNRDGSFTCTLFWPQHGPDGFEGLTDRESILERFSSRYPDTLPLMPALDEEFRANPVGSLLTIRAWPWQRAGKVVLIGDAAHAIVPFYGQGANCAFEDCVELDACLAAFPDDPEAALTRYQERRKPNAEAIADLALENFVEMRDRVASPLFRLRKRGEHALERLLPGRYVSLYELISFSTVPYAEARRRARRQNAIVAAVAASTIAGVVLLAARRARR
jgi:kynurenine 3-monooxygenase